MGKILILPETTKNPITMIGKMAGICWGADTSSDERNYKRGWDCLTSGHGRTFEFPDVYMQVDGYSAGVVREWYTHIGGAPTRLQASTRYIPYGGFGYVTPPSIVATEGAEAIYDRAMTAINEARQQLAALGIKPEDSRNLLPLGMTTSMVCKHNLRNLIDMSRQRMCNRAYWEYRELFGDLQIALCDYSSEWMALVTSQFMPKCKAAGFCTEKHGCGMMPKRDEVEK